MKKIITTLALVLSCTAALAQTTNPIIVQGPDGKITQCINTGGVIRCY